MSFLLSVLYCWSSSRIQCLLCRYAIIDIVVPWILSLLVILASQTALIRVPQDLSVMVRLRLVFAQLEYN